MYFPYFCENEKNGGKISEFINSVIFLQRKNIRVIKLRLRSRLE